MKKRIALKLFHCISSFVLLSLLNTHPALPREPERVQVTLDATEADQVLAILVKRLHSQTITDADWNALLSTEPYRRLKLRETAMHRPFTDEDFRKFVLSEELIAQCDALARTLAAWKIADLRASAFRVLPYLPAQAIIQVKVFPIIKPQHNSFVFDMDKDPVIFLYLNPAISPQEFQHTVAHEMHHIGLSSTDAFYQKKVQLLPPPAQKAALWMGAFGERLAVLAAAGGPDLPPNQFSQPDVRLNWQRGMDTFNTDLVTLDRFFLGILDGRLKGDAADEKAFTFFGEIQGPWYTVGYNMATIIEKRFGRQSLIECMLDPRLLLQRYNQTAQECNSAGRDHLALWSAELLNAVLPGDSPASTR